MSEAGGSNSNFGQKRNNNKDSGGAFSDKKPFNKKKWRTDHYSFKSKLDEHVEHRKKSLIRNYHKTLLKEDKTAVNPAIRLNKGTQPGTTDVKKQRFIECEEAKAIYHRKLNNMKKQHKERLKQRSKECDKIAASRAKRTERFKKVSAKTKHGQPVMKGRLQLMLQEIEDKIGQGTWK